MSWERHRVRAAWLLVLPFVVLARPTPESWVLGGVFAGLGTGLRTWAAGCVDKNRSLCTWGPYAFVRNPLYLGSLLLGLGAGIAGGHPIWLVVFGGFFWAMYPRTVAAEEAKLARRFGPGYAAYAAQVPALVPRLRPARDYHGQGSRFRLDRFLRNREWEAWIGAAACFAYLALRAW